jgi:hypothetical protein
MLKKWLKRLDVPFNELMIKIQKGPDLKDPGLFAVAILYIKQIVVFV